MKIKSSFKIPDSILAQIQWTISKYGLFDKGSEVVLGYSGGKDSSFLLAALQQLGFKVRPVIINVWPGFKADRVKELSKTLGVEATIINVRSPEYQNSLPDPQRNQLGERLYTIDGIAKRLEQEKRMGPISPCTECYNTKAAALFKYGIDCGVNSIVIGQHEDDGLSSFLKMAAMVWDYRNNKLPYLHSRFIQVTNLFGQKLSCQTSSSDLLAEVEGYVNEGMVSTDDPPRQLWTYPGTNHTAWLTRPMFEVAEMDIIAWRDKNKIGAESSGCAHGLSNVTSTPRELIHQSVVRNLHETNRKILRRLMESGLEKNGSLKVNTRNSRDQILPGYRPKTHKLMEKAS